jgi:hypothetical protein
MTTIEQRLSDALSAGAAGVRPAPDLFARVQQSVDVDRHHQRRVARYTVIGLAIAAGLAAIVMLTSDFREGRLLMDWWILELITTGLLVGLALWLGPFIKRFGRSYAADVFRSSPRTGKSFIILTDIVYYLIFVAYILFTASVFRREGWTETVGAGQVQFELARIGGILLIIGILHGANLLIMPVLGRLFSMGLPPEE